VPQGSFSNHFVSKEAFGVEILDLYFGFTKKVLADTLNNKDLKPLKRLEAYIDANQAFLEQWDVENGCLYGTYAAEIAGHDEPVRRRLVEIFKLLEGSLTACLKEAVKAGELPQDFNCKEVGDFILSSLQGAILLSNRQEGYLPEDQVQARPLRQHPALTRVGTISDIGPRSDWNAGPWMAGGRPSSLSVAAGEAR
jgi:TetR/AcrR family transcriptional regulator, transcriptional repressor for nem operon